jgi:hypothetical protein
MSARRIRVEWATTYLPQIGWGGCFVTSLGLSSAIFK